MLSRMIPVLALLAAVAGAQEAATLKVGDDAPPLTIAKWVKGDPVTPGQGMPCVIEFWATWCGPCIASMPHLSELQETYKGKVAFVGVTSEDTKGNTLERAVAMVDAKGPGMGYAVAWDDGRKTNAAWMAAAGQTGIPCAFVVDGKGKIAFIGHPQMLDLPLAWLVAGKWDPAKSPAEMGAVYQRAQEIFQMDRAIALNALPAFEKEHPELSASFAEPKFELLARAGKKEEASALGAELVEKAVKFNSDQALNEIAWFLVDPKTEISDRNLDLAFKAATKAVEISKGEDGAILDTLARVHYWKGDLAKAVEIQAKAVEKAADSPEMLGDLEATLDEYKAQAAGTGKKE